MKEQKCIIRFEISFKNVRVNACPIGIKIIALFCAQRKFAYKSDFAKTRVRVIIFHDIDLF